ncbi:hypothetical protein [Microbacterium sp. MRS-1]|uniref:hypothetical protein n=1 Tax=Microbacterium sp. MRS-1 TaxID=1451261 RepID=UPI00044A68F2|nr:hypothetical protein [Microbacterium sp. MRS-1]EXJ51966.1 hypothetical protein AS96_07315 [Microbacterium sp. MRS-1]
MRVGSGGVTVARQVQCHDERLVLEALHQVSEHLATHADPVHQHHGADGRGIASALRHDARAAVCEDLDAPVIGRYARDLVDRAIDGIRQLRDRTPARPRWPRAVRARC